MNLIFDLRKILRSPFSWRIFSRLTGCILLFGFLYFGVALFMQQHLISSEMTENSHQLAEIYAHAIRLGIFSEDQELMKTPTEAVLHHNAVQAACAFSDDGRLLFQSGKKTDGNALSCFSSSAKINEILKNLSASGRHQVLREGESIQIWAPVYAEKSFFSEEDLLLKSPEASNSHQLLGAVSIVLDKSIIRKTFNRLFVSYLLLTLAFVLMGIFTTSFITRDATTPLRRLLFSINRRTGKKNENIQDEIETLAGTFDRLIEDLNQSFGTIQDLKEGLEDKVSLRTAELVKRHQELTDANKQLEKALLDLKSTQSQLVQSEKMAALGQLVAGMAHEINNNTNFVYGAVPPLGRSIAQLKVFFAARGNDKKELGSDKVPPLFDDIDQLLGNIKEGTKRTINIVRDLRDFSRPDMGEPVRADIHQGIDATLSLLRPEYKHRIEITRDYDPNMGLFACYPNQLNQVFMNILLNAIQAIEGEGSITISTLRQEDGVHIRFKDSGIGIPSSVRAHIFDPFFTTKEVGKGTGLGLSISYAIIKKHNGEVRVKSEEGEGTEFEIVLPVGC